MLIFPLKKNIDISLDSAENAIKQLSKDWDILIQDNTQSIMEINALDEDSKKERVAELEKIISNNLPDDDPTEIITGFLAFDYTPYEDYIKDQSVNWVTDTASKVAEEHIERYLEEMAEYLLEQSFNTNFGKYYFQINVFALENEVITETSYTHAHNADWYGIVEPFSNPIPNILEEDVVNMEDFQFDTAPEYLELLADKNKKDGEIIYTAIADEFKAENHAKAIEEIVEFLNKS